MAKAEENKNLERVKQDIDETAAEAEADAEAEGVEASKSVEKSAPAKTKTEAGREASPNLATKQEKSSVPGKTAAPPAGTGQTVRNTQSDPESLLEQKLKELAAKLAQQQQKLAQLTQENKILEADKAALVALIAEFTKILDKYAAALAKLHEQKDEMNRYTENKTPMIEVAVKDHLDDINEIYAANDQIISDLEDELGQLKTAWEDAQEQHAAAKETFELAKAEFDNLKVRQKGLEDDLKKLQQLRKTIESEEELNHFGVMYFLIGEFNDLLNSLFPRLVTVDALEDALISAWAAQDAAQYEFRKHESNLAGSKKNYDDKLAELKLAQQHKRDTIIMQLSQIEF